MEDGTERKIRTAEGDTMKAHNPLRRPKEGRRRQRYRREEKVQPQGRQQTVPLEFAGKWIVWSEDRLHILFHGETLEEVWAEAEKKGIEEKVVFEPVPRVAMTEEVKSEVSI